MCLWVKERAHSIKLDTEIFIMFNSPFLLLILDLMVLWDAILQFRRAISDPEVKEQSEGKGIL